LSNDIIARSLLVTKANRRPDELASHVSRCPSSILARSTSRTVSDDTGTVTERETVRRLRRRTVIAERG
jgi:hypothetical protein